MYNKKQAFAQQASAWYTLHRRRGDAERAMLGIRSHKEKSRNKGRTGVSNRIAITMDTKKLNWLDWVVMVLVIVGGLNWGLYGIFGFDLVAYLFGAMTVLSRIVYVLVGLAALYLLIIVGKLEKK